MSISSHSSSRLASGLVLLFFAAVILLERVHTRYEPLERDMPTYAVVAQAMLHGRSLYLGIFDQKPPAIYLTYAAAELLAGYDRAMIFDLGVAAALVSLIGIFYAGTALSGRTQTGLWAAGLWTLLNTDLFLQANQPNAEVFMNAALIWALFLMARSRQTVMSLPDAIGSGALIVWASMYKTVIAADAVCLLAAYVLFPPGGAANRRLAFFRALASGITMLTGWALVFLFFAAEGHFRAFYNAVIVYNRAYAGSLAANFALALRPQYLTQPFLVFTVPLVLLAIIGFDLSLRRRSVWPWPLLLGFALGTQLCIALPGQFSAHYYQLWLPLLCLAPALALEAVAEAAPRLRWLSPALGVFVLMVVLTHELPFYRLSATQWSLLKYGPEFVQAHKAGEAINALLLPQEQFYDADEEPELYLTAHRLPPTAIFYSEATLRPPFAQVFTRRLMQDLHRNPPALVVVFTAQEVPNTQVAAWIERHYLPLPASRSPRLFQFWARRGSALAKREGV